MERLLYTIAALATSAVPGFDVVLARRHTRSTTGFCDAVLLRDPNGVELLVRTPNGDEGARALIANDVALSAMTVGVRAQLPFIVPEVVGRAQYRDLSVIVESFVPGSTLTPPDLDNMALLPTFIGAAIAAIHGLPSGFVHAAGLERLSAENVRMQLLNVLPRASKSGKVPALLIRRWDSFLNRSAAWSFAPTVVNGQLELDSFIIDNSAVSGIVGWAGLHSGDPARDLKWVKTSAGPAGPLIVDEYVTARMGAADPFLVERAEFYAEWDLLLWLLHGVEAGDPKIIQDAEKLLGELLNRVQRAESQTSWVSGGQASAEEVERASKDAELALSKFKHSDSGRSAMLTDSFSPDELAEAVKSKEDSPAPETDWHHSDSATGEE